MKFCSSCSCAGWVYIAVFIFDMFLGSQYAHSILEKARTRNNVVRIYSLKELDGAKDLAGLTVLLWMPTKEIGFAQIVDDSVRDLMVIKFLFLKRH